MFGMIIAVLVSLVQPAFAQDSRCGLTFQVTCDDCVAGDVWTGEVTDQFGNSFGVKDRMESGGQMVASAPPGTSLTFWANDQQITTVVCTVGSNTQTVRLTRQQVVKPVDGDEDADTGDTVETADTADTDDAGDTADAQPLPDNGAIPEGKAHNVGWGAAVGEPLWLGNPGDYPSARELSRCGHFTGKARQCPEGTIPEVIGTANQIDGGQPAQVALDDQRATDVAPSDWNWEYVGYTGTVTLGKDAAAIYCVLPTTITRREPAATAAVIPPPQGDLVVEKLSGPTNLAVGGEGNFKATVRNTGNATVPASWLRFEMDGARLDEVAVPPLAAGESAEVKSATWKGTSSGLHTPNAIADSRKEVPEANEWDNERDGSLYVAPPAKKSGGSEPTPTFRLIMRKGLFLTGQYTVNTDDTQANYLHVLFGGFVTFNIIPRGKWLGLEPYLGVGSDGQSDHCAATDDAPGCSGWFLSTIAGVRLPITVNPKSKVQFMLYPDIAIVSDDVTVGFTSWADLVSVKVGGELWFTGYAPFAVSLAAGGTRLAFMDANAHHQNGYAVPVELSLKAAFK